MLQFIFSGLNIHVMLWQHCAYDLVMFRHSVRVRKRPCFGFKISVLFPQTWLEMYRRPVKNISIYCRHKHDWKMSLELLKHIQQCHACRCWDAIVPLQKYPVVSLLWRRDTTRFIEMFIRFTAYDTHTCEYMCIYMVCRSTSLQREENLLISEELIKQHTHQSLLQLCQTVDLCQIHILGYF